MSASRFQRGPQQQRPQPQQQQYRIERRNGAPVPCRQWCHDKVVGQPVPADPANGFPNPGCQAHLNGGIKRGIPCTVGDRDGKMRFFAHPDQPEWQQVPGVKQSEEAIKNADPEWRQGHFAKVVRAPSPERAPREHRGKLVVVPEKALQQNIARQRSGSPLRLNLKEGELSWGDAAYLEDNPSAAKYFEGRKLPNLFSGILPAAQVASTAAASMAAAGAGPAASGNNWRQAKPSTYRRHGQGQGRGRGFTAASGSKKRTQRNRRN